MIVTGEPGSGKSSLGLHLASSLRLPYLSRDDVRWGLHATAGIWRNELGQASDRNVARAAFIEIVEEVARRGVSGVLEFIPFRDRPHELQRLRALAECLVVLTRCTDASRRAADRERSDALLNRPPVLAALGHASVDDYLRDGAEQRRAVREAMLTEFDVPTLEVHTNDGYDPALDEIVEWVITQTDG